MDTKLYQRYTVVWQKLLESGGNRQNSYTDKQNNHFGPDTHFERLVHGHNTGLNENSFLQAL